MSTGSYLGVSGLARTRQIHSESYTDVAAGALHAGEFRYTELPAAASHGRRRENAESWDGVGRPDVCCSKINRYNLSRFVYAQYTTRLRPGRAK